MKKIIALLFFSLILSLLTLTAVAEELNPDDFKVQKYKDWEISRFNDAIIYTTHGMAVHGHKFGWVKRAGHCNKEFMYLTFSSMHKDKGLLEKIVKSDVPVEVVFPQMEPNHPAKLYMYLVAVNDLTFGGTKIATFTGIENNQMFDAFMEHFNLIEIEIVGAHQALFDIPVDTWSLDGYIAAKTKAQEMCEAIITDETSI